MAASATDLEEIVEVIPTYFVEQIVAGATDHGGNREVPPGGAAGAVRGL